MPSTDHAAAKKRAKQQQSVVNDLIACQTKVSKIPNRSVDFLDQTQQFAEGQLNVHLCLINQQLDAAIECFEDCADEGVEIHRVTR